MKPLNAENPGCNPMSSNCVTWQGPDIECIKLCKGDTISDVTAKLAFELCTVMETLNVSSYDLSCFNITGCSPQDFKALLQFLMGRICKLENCTGCIPDCNGNSTMPNSGNTLDGCPDCLVAIAPCFYYQNQFGDQVTSMQLSDYVITIGNYLCGVAGTIVTINETLASLQEQIDTIAGRAPIPFAIPEFVPVCVLPPVSTDIATILAALEQQFCQLRNATGTPDEIYAAIAKQCAALNTAPALGPGGGTMGGLTGWVNSPTNASDALNNIWLTLCDLRAAVTNIKLNCCPGDCDAITLNLQLELDVTTLKLFFTGNVPAGFQNCNPAGSLFTITDTSGGLVNVYVDVVGYMNNVGGYFVDLSGTPLNLSDNLTVVSNPCFHNNATGITCQSCLEAVYYNTVTCPAMTLNPLLTSISYSAPVAAGTATYTIEVWDAAGAVLITSFSESIVGPGTFTGSIGGLTAGTLYKVRLTITINGVTTTCPFQSVSTLGEVG